MNLLDRYLKAVRNHLPEEQRDDIVRELSEDIRSKIDEREAELGRSLKEPEMEAILKSYGHPLIVAGRYRQDGGSFSFGKQLIGPTLFPFYTKVLTFNLGITTVILIFIFTILSISSGQRGSLLSSLPSVFFFQLLIQFAIVTLIFIVVDRNLSKHPDRWDPRSPSHPANLVAPQTGDRVPRIESFSKLIGLAVMLVWLNFLQPLMVLGPTARFVKFAPIWHQLYLPVVLIGLVAMTQAGINLVRPEWIRVRSFTRVGVGAAILALYVFLLKQGPWVVATDAAGDLTHAATIDVINQVFFYSFVVCVILSAVQLLRDVYRLGRESHVPGGSGIVLHL